MTNAVNIAQGGSNNVTMRNRIINGAMVIDQRNAGAAWGTSINGFCVDRWACYQSTTGKINGGQNYNSLTPPTGYSSYIGVQSQSAYSVGASDYYVFRQPIEGYNIADLSWGTASAATVTLSFWVRSSLTGTFGGSVSNGSVSYPFTYTISSANTWEQKTVTIAGPSTGTWGSSNALGLYVYLGFGVGSTYSGTAGSWGAGNYYTATGATSVVGTNGATFYITGVQLEAGTTASPFEYRQYGTELALCQRYYYLVASGTASPISMSTYFLSGNLSGMFNFPVMRTSPTFTNTSGTNYYRNQANGTLDDFNSMTVDRVTPQTMMWYNVTEVSGTQGVGGVVYGISASSFIALSAEL